MSIFGPSPLEEKLARLLENEQKETKLLLHIVHELVQKQPHSNRVRLILTQSINNSNYQIMSLTLASNQQSVGTLGLQDTVTGQPVTASFSNVQATPSSPNFTADIDASNNITVKGVSEGSGFLTVNALVAYTDSTGQAQNQTLSVNIDISIVAVVSADGVALVVNFGPATQQ